MKWPIVSLFTTILLLPLCFSLQPNHEPNTLGEHRGEARLIINNAFSPSYWEKMCFSSESELMEFVRFYRNYIIPTYGEGQCENAAWDFAFYCLINQKFVMSETLDNQIIRWEYEDGVGHEFVKVPIGNEVYLVDIISGNIKYWCDQD